MILFLIPVTTIPFGGYYFQCMEDYMRNPFEKGSKLDEVARQILHYGIDLHVGPYVDFEHAVEQLELFEIAVRKVVRTAVANNEAIGPAHVYTKGLTIVEIQQLLSHMQKNNTSCMLAVNLLPHDQPLDTVNPYCMNKLE